MNEINNLAYEAAKDEQKLDEFILKNEIFITKCTSKITHKYINKSDDEWSVALIAFSEAVKSYNMDKGNFLSFAKLLISRRLIDFYRTKEKNKLEVLIDPYLFNTDSDENDTDIQIRTQIAKKVSVRTDDTLKHEIEDANTIFMQYGFTFMDLAESSPHSKKTKTACAKAVLYIISQSIIISELNRTKKLNLKLIEINTKVPRKILERHRKYIIAATVILSGEYPGLANYMRYIREETHL